MGYASLTHPTGCYGSGVSDGLRFAYPSYGVGVGGVLAGGAGGAQGVIGGDPVMAKGQKNSGREPKKPKANKTSGAGKSSPSASLVASSRPEPPAKASRTPK